MSELIPIEIRKVEEFKTGENSTTTEVSVQTSLPEQFILELLRTVILEEPARPE